MHSNVFFSPHETGKSIHKLVPDIEFQSVYLCDYITYLSVNCHSSILLLSFSPTSNRIHDLWESVIMGASMLLLLFFST